MSLPIAAVQNKDPQLSICIFADHLCSLHQKCLLLLCAMVAIQLHLTNYAKRYVFGLNKFANQSKSEKGDSYTLTFGALRVI